MYKSLLSIDPNATAEQGAEGQVHPSIRREARRIARSTVNKPPRSYAAIIAVCIERNLPEAYPKDIFEHDLRLISDEDLDTDFFLWSLGPCGSHLFKFNEVLEGVQALRRSYSENVHFWWNGSSLCEVTLDEAQARYHDVSQGLREFLASIGEEEALADVLG